MARIWILSVCVQKHEILKISYTFPTPFCSLENASWGSSHSCTIMVQEYPHRKMRNKTGVWAPRLIFITFLSTPHVPQDVFSFTSWTMLARTIAILIITKLDSCCESTWKILYIVPFYGARYKIGVDSTDLTLESDSLVHFLFRFVHANVIQGPV